MPEFVIFSLVAPMGAFGDLAGHERRGSYSWPGRSAILGLLGAALGVRRDDVAGQAQLSNWCMAVSVLAQGAAFRDFHTVQSVPSARIKRPSTRRAALAALTPDDNAVITRRDYHSDCAFGVALWGGRAPGAMVEALKRPVFTPYLGRKSCPLSAPLAPDQIEVEDALAALARVRLPNFLALDPGRPVFVASDDEMGPGRSETRWDTPLDRTAWHFGSRTVHIMVPGVPAEGEK